MFLVRFMCIFLKNHFPKLTKSAFEAMSFSDLQDLVRNNKSTYDLIKNSDVNVYYFE